MELSGGDSKLKFMLHFVFLTISVVEIVDLSSQLIIWNLSFAISTS